MGEKCGMKNFRIDNMDDDYFDIINERLIKPEHYNNNWKTARLFELYHKMNPHWNLYHSKLYKYCDSDCSCSDCSCSNY